MDRNLYWDTAGWDLDFAGWTWEEWQQRGQDVHSRVVDPLFVDPDRADFRFQPGSPALEVGFQPIDTDGIGLYGDGEEKGASIRVSNETASLGQHSLKITDAPGLEHVWQPHVYFQPNIRGGTIRFSFDLLIEEGATFLHEWRDWRGSV